MIRCSPRAVPSSRLRSRGAERTHTENARRGPRRRATTPTRSALDRHGQHADETVDPVLIITAASPPTRGSGRGMASGNHTWNGMNPAWCRSDHGEHERGPRLEDARKPSSRAIRWPAQQTKSANTQRGAECAATRYIHPALRTLGFSSSKVTRKNDASAITSQATRKRTALGRHDHDHGRHEQVEEEPRCPQPPRLAIRREVLRTYTAARRKGSDRHQKEADRASISTRSAVRTCQPTRSDSVAEPASTRSAGMIASVQPATARSRRGATPTATWRRGARAHRCQPTPRARAAAAALPYPSSVSCACPSPPPPAAPRPAPGQPALFGETRLNRSSCKANSSRERSPRCERTVGDQREERVHRLSVERRRSRPAGEKQA